ncbi:MAG TPA: TonB-dependent siderophore receptor [Telluria sp.]|jgi:catecholate siderophore receptor
MFRPAAFTFRPRMTPIALAARLTLAGVLAASGAHAFAQAATEETTLQEVKIVGTAEPTYVVKSSATGTKTDTLLRDTPQAITVITKELMRDQNMQSMADVIRYVPGIVSAQGEGNRDTAVFRGNSSTGDFYIDGVRDDVQYFRDFYNIESVEALKGSNAMIFGRGGSGGVINRVSKVPQWTPVREASVTLGSYRNRRASADLGQAIGANAAFRINAMVEDSDSYRDAVNVKRKGINPTLALRAGKDTSIVLGYEHFQDERTADRGVPSFAGRPLATDPGKFFGNPDLSEATVLSNALTALIDHDFGNGLTLRNRSRYASYDKFYQNVFASLEAKPASNQVTLAAYNNATERTNLFNQTDLFYTLNAGSVRHKLVAGLELGRQETDNLRNTGRFNGATSAVVSITNPVYAGPIVFTPSATDANNHGVATVASVYLQDQIEFSPQWQVVAGLRYDRFNVKFDNYVASATRYLEVRDTPLSPRLGLVYKPAEAVSIYGSYSLAFVPRAGDQLGSLTGANRDFDPEEFKNLELGAKWDITPDLAASVAIYKLDRSNVVVTDPADSTRSLLLDGQTSKGLELGLSGKLTQAWSVMGGYAWQDAKLASLAGSTVLTGKTLAMVPKHSLSLWNRYDFSQQWGAALGVVYRDDIFAAADNAVTLPAFTRVDGAVFYKLNKNYQLQMNIENLLDKAYFASANSNNNITPGSPRALRVTLNARF